MGLMRFVLWRMLCRVLEKRPRWERVLRCRWVIVVRRDSVDGWSSGSVEGVLDVSLCLGGVGGSIERREWRGRECGVSIGRSPGGIGIRGGRCLRWWQEGSWKGCRLESSERDWRAGRESVLWW